MRVRTTVHVRSEDGAKTAVLKPGDPVPDWAEVTNGAALLDAPEAKPAAAPAASVEVPAPVEAPAAPVEAETPTAPAAKPAARRKPAAKAAEAKAE